MRPGRRFIAAALLCSGVVALAEAEAPYRPLDDDAVLLELPRSLVRQADALSELQAAQRRAPNDLGAATALAQAYLRLGRRDADPRYVAYAQAVLTPWWDLSAPAVEVAVLRAAILRYQHDFDAAETDLRRVLERRPGHVQALLDLAMLRQLRGDPLQARHICGRLLQAGDGVLSSLCLASALGMSGGASEAERLLASLEGRVREGSAELYQWMLSMRADLAERRGQVAQAAQLFARAADPDLPNPALARRHADLLLAEGMHQQVLRLLARYPDDDGLRLRALPAARSLGDEQTYQRLRGQLELAFRAAELRGDARHAREEAEFLLLTGAPANQALELALVNWKMQREPEDLLLLLRAALAAGQAEAVRPALQWRDEVGLEDVRADALVRALDRASPRS